MRAGLWLVGALLAVGGVVPTSMTRPIASAEAPAAAAQGSSTLDDQTELALTVYNSNIALVRDVRTLQLPRGTFDLQFMDIGGGSPKRHARVEGAVFTILIPVGLGN